LIEESAIVQTINVSDLLAFARTGRVRRMRNVLNYIVVQPHAFGLLEKLPFKLPKLGFETGRLVGNVLSHLNIPDEYKVLIARKVLLSINFGERGSSPRQRGYLRGVLGLEETDSDGDIAGMDTFVESDEEHDSDATYWDDDDDEYGFTHRTANGTSAESEDSDSEESEASTDESEMDDEQTLLYAQLHATLNEAIQSAPPPKMLQLSHIEVPRLTARKLAAFKAAPDSSTKIDVVDLTKSGDEAEAKKDDAVNVVDEAGTDNDDVIEVSGRRRVTVGYEQDVVEVSATERWAKPFELPVRSASARTTTGPRGLERLEMDVEVEVMEIMKFD
jgi:hypothetical protein